VLYTAGNYLILHNIETAVQKFIPIIAQESVLSTENPVKAATRFIAILQENEEKARRAQRLPLNYAMNTMQVSPDKNLVALAHHYNGDLPNDGEVGVAIIQIIDLKKMRQTAILRTSITTVSTKSS
jgi:hypothetical protein